MAETEEGSCLLFNLSHWQWQNCTPAQGPITGQPVLGWISIRGDGVIEEVGHAGTEPDASAYVRVVDGGGALALPGLIDSHIHVAGLGESMRFLQLGACGSISALQACLAAATSGDGRGGGAAALWVQGTHWDQEKLGRYPTRRDLDAVCAHRPVLLWRMCWHIVVCNSEALRLAGLLSEDGLSLPPTFMPPEGGLVDLDEQSSPTGVLRETAVELVLAVTGAKTLRQKRRCVQDGLKQCVRHGLTAVQTNDERCLRVYRELQAERLLPMRVFLTPISALSLSRKNSSRDAGDAGGAGELVCERVKLFADGSLGAETAAIRKVASQTNSEHTGVLIHARDALQRQMETTRARGFRLEVHAIGDAAAESVLDCMLAAGVSEQERPVLTHCQVLGQDLYEKMSALGCIANVQPSFVPTDAAWVQARLSAAHIEFSYAWKTLLYYPGITVAGGSDAPIETPAPLVGIYDAIHRTARDEVGGSVFRPEECLGFAEALWTYTVGGALSCGCDHILGRLEAGYAADLVLVDPAVLTEPHASLKAEHAVRRTLVGGRTCYAYDEQTDSDSAASASASASAAGLGGPFQLGKNGHGRRKGGRGNPWGGKCGCCYVR
eukprot:GSChrysophyteH2.ASY1.ANO1.946.1 assembled CDS